MIVLRKSLKDIVEPGGGNDMKQEYGYIIHCPICDCSHHVKDNENYSIDCRCGTWLKRGE